MKFVTFLMLWLFPWASFAGGPTYAVISSDVTGNTSNGVAVRFLAGEVVEISDRSRGNQLLARSVQAQYGTDYVPVPANAVLYEHQFSRLKKWSGQHKFATWSHSYDSGCIVNFDNDGTFFSKYKCNCENERNIRGFIYSRGNILWAKGACDESIPFNQWSIYVRQKDGQLCQVADDPDSKRSVCVQTEGN